MPPRKGQFSNCKTCQKQIWRMPSHIRDGEKLYCGRDCRTKDMKGRLSAFNRPRDRSGPNNPSWVGGLVVINCAICGKEYRKSPKASKTSKYCSRRCHGDSLKKEKAVLKCDVCHLSFLRFPGEVKKSADRGAVGVYCSRPCRYKAFAEEQRGSANHCWKGGITPSTVRIRTAPEGIAWRKAVFARDNWACQTCGIRNAVGLGKAVKLNAHHIKRFLHYPELRYEVSNGITLCSDCHKSEHRQERESRRAEKVAAKARGNQAAAL